MIKLGADLGRRNKWDVGKNTHRLPFGFLLISLFNIFFFFMLIRGVFVHMQNSLWIWISIWYPHHTHTHSFACCEKKVFNQGKFDEWIWEILLTIEIILRAWNFKRLSCAQPKNSNRNAAFVIWIPLRILNAHILIRSVESDFPLKYEPIQRIVINIT